MKLSWVGTGAYRSVFWRLEGLWSVRCSSSGASLRKRSHILRNMLMTSDITSSQPPVWHTRTHSHAHTHTIHPHCSNRNLSLESRFLIIALRINPRFPRVSALTQFYLHPRFLSPDTLFSLTDIISSAAFVVRNVTSTAHRHPSSLL